MTARHILTISCPDTVGIVAAVSGFLAGRGVQHHRQRPVWRSRKRALLHARFLLGAPRAHPGQGVEAAFVPLFLNAS